MPLVPVEVPLTMIQIRILPVLLLQFNSGPCLLLVSQPVYPGETIPTKLLHGPELIWLDQPLPIAVRIPILNLAQWKPINEHCCDERVCNMMIHVESLQFDTQCKYMD